MQDREVMQLALDALEDAYDAINCWGDYASPYFQEKHGLEEDITNCKKAIEALRARLAQGEATGRWVGDKEFWEDPKQTEPEPVAWMCPDDPDRETAFSWQSGHCVDCGKQKVPLYTAPPQRPWQGLTDDERKEIFESMPGGMDGFLRTWGWLPFSKALEQKLKEKNT